MNTKFKAMATINQQDLDFHSIPHNNGWIEGYYIDGYIVGGIIEANSECVTHEWWCPIEVNTLEYLGGK